MSSLKKNLGYQTVYQILITALPLITSPYLSRKLGATQLGVFSYTQSIVAYFTLFAMLGFSTYGVRKIASVKSEQSELNQTFSGIFSLQLIASSIAILIYAVYLIFICKQNTLIAVIQMVSIFSCLVNINWLFFGLEEFKITVVRNIIIRITSVTLILLLVKSEKDLWIYALLMVGSDLLSNLVLWLYVPRFVRLVRVEKEALMRHIKPSLVLFIPIAAMSVYHTMDKTMLGYIAGFTQSGYYYNADKIINISAGVISGFGTVYMPRVSALLGQSKLKEADALFKQSLKITVYVAAAMTFGIAAIADKFVPFFFGKGYETCIQLTIVLSPVLIIKAFAFSVRYQYLIPRQEDGVYIKSVIAGAVVNLIFNSLLIPKLGAMGAIIGTLIAELTACFMQFFAIRNELKMRKDLLQCMAYIVLGVIMYVIVRYIPFEIGNDILLLLVKIIVGVVSYMVLSLLYFLISGEKEFRDALIGMLKTIFRRL